MRPPTKIMRIASQIFDALPTTMSGLSQATGMNKKDVRTYLARIKKEPRRRDGQRLLTFTVAPAARGPFEQTYRAVKFEKDGSYYSDPTSFQDIENGSFGNLRMAATASDNVAKTLTYYSTGIRPSARKRVLEDLAYEARIFADRAKRVIEKVMADIAESG